MDKPRSYLTAQASTRVEIVGGSGTASRTAASLGRKSTSQRMPRKSKKKRQSACKMPILVNKYEEAFESAAATVAVMAVDH